MADDTTPGGKGMLAAIDEALERWHAEADEEDAQLGLFAEPMTEAGRAMQHAYRRGPGRPPGSRNRRTERTAAFLLARHRDPREILLEIAEANVADLAALLRCDPLAAMQEKRLAATAVLPYLTSRLPLEIDVSKKSLVYLTIEGGMIEQAAAEDDAGISMTVRVLDGVSYQQTGEAVQRGVLSPPRGRREAAPDDPAPEQPEPPPDHNNFPPGVTRLKW